MAIVLEKYIGCCINKNFAAGQQSWLMHPLLLLEIQVPILAETVSFFSLFEFNYVGWLTSELHSLL
jgi:hypothetical protein